VTGWAGTFHWSEDPSTAWLVPSTTEDLALVENRFLEAGKGAENTKEKSRPCFTVREASIYLSIYLSLDLPLQDIWSLEACYAWKDSKARPFFNTQRTVGFFWHCILLVASDA
jgi:hypothetical protein